MFERFTEPSRAVLVEAQDVAMELGSRYLDVGHLLCGCAETREETAGRPLHETGITGAIIRKALPRGEEPPAGQVDPEALRAIGIDYDGGPRGGRADIRGRSTRGGSRTSRPDQPWA